MPRRFSQCFKLSPLPAAPKLSKPIAEVPKQTSKVDERHPNPKIFKNPILHDDGRVLRPLPRPRRRVPMSQKQKQKQVPLAQSGVHRVWKPHSLESSLGHLGPVKLVFGGAWEPGGICSFFSKIFLRIFS